VAILVGELLGVGWKNGQSRTPQRDRVVNEAAGTKSVNGRRPAVKQGDSGMRALGLVFCESFQVDPETRQVSLAGLFQARSFSRFPSKRDSFTVYSALTGPKPEEGSMELIVTDLQAEAGRDIYRREWWYRAPGGLVYHLSVPVTIKAYKTPGRYLISLRFDGKIMTNRFLDVFRKE
jgi:hypothetical protein